MAVIVLAGNKGGSGKTTLAINLAAALACRSPTILLDADPQGSAVQWGKIRVEASVLPVVRAVKDTRRSIRDSRNDYDHVVVDCPPSVLASQLAEALTEATMVLIPVQPSPMDLWATVHIEPVLAQAREKNRDLRALIVINQLEPRTMLSQVMRDAVTEFQVQVAETAIRRRAVYRNSILEGRTVLDMGRRGDAAVKEIRGLLDEVLSS